MDAEQQMKLEEYKFLRQEHENNRKFVFERPLIIVGGMLAAAVGLRDNPGNVLGLLPLPFLALLWFNLWFTFNRLQSSSRIVAYLQLVHEPNSTIPWIGWENSLRKYRQRSPDNNIKKTVSVTSKKFKQADSMRFYGPIYGFHLLIGVAFTFLLLIQSGLLPRYFSGTFLAADGVWLVIDTIALVLFVLGFIPYFPSGIKHEIEEQRCIWEELLGKSSGYGKVGTERDGLTGAPES
jgi:hypothetical protein